jgi:two-component system sensor histidine kinase KdpD
VLLEVSFVMITEVLSNLIENAAKYSPGGGAISISARLQGPMMEFSVRDDGVGVAPDEQARIFDKFYRVEGKYRPTRSGMGLAISRGFVEAHGGRIWCARTPSVVRPSASPCRSRFRNTFLMASDPSHRRQ